jgi:hypothetical protein
VQFIGQILSGPVLIMLAIAPEPAPAHVIDNPLKRAPDLGPVLPVAGGQL